MGWGNISEICLTLCALQPCGWWRGTAAMALQTNLQRSTQKKVPLSPMGQNARCQWIYACSLKGAIPNWCNYAFLHSCRTRKPCRDGPARWHKWMHCFHSKWECHLYSTLQRLLYILHTPLLATLLTMAATQCCLQTLEWFMGCSMNHFYNPSTRRKIPSYAWWQVHMIWKQALPQCVNYYQDHQCLIRPQPSEIKWVRNLNWWL